jgi:hypothetical protein
MISSTIRKVGPFVGTGLVSTFPFSFKVFASSDLKAVQADSGGNETALVLNSNFTASLNADQDNNPGGSITLSAALPTGSTLIITTAMPETQTVQLTDLGGFYPAVLNSLHDKVTIMAQQLQEQIDRCLKFPITDPSSSAIPVALTRASKALGFAADGTLTTLAQIPSVAGVTGTGNVVLQTSPTINGAPVLSQLGIGSVVLLDPSGANIGNLVIDSSANVNAKSLSTNQTSTGDYAIPNVFRLGLNPSANSTQLQMGISEEGWTYSSNSKTFSGSQLGVYGSFSHFGSGSANAIYGASFEGFNAGPSTVTQVCGVNGNAWCGGVAAGAPIQTPTNNGAALNLRGVQAHVANISSGVVTAAAGVYINSGTNSGGGSITTLVGLEVTDMTAGVANFAIRTALGKNQFGDETHFVKTFTQGTGAPSTSVGAQLIPALSGATTQFGLQEIATTNASATVQATGIIARADVAASTAQTFNMSFVAQDAVKGGGATITNSYGYYAIARTSGTANYGFYSEAGNRNAFLTSIEVGGGTALTTTNQTGTVSIVMSTSPTITTPTLSGAVSYVSQTIGIGNGAGANLTAPAHGTGSGPASLVAVQWRQVSINAATYWIPLYQ